MKQRKCLDCEVDISSRHYNAKRCESCAKIQRNRWKDSDRNSYFIRTFGVTLIEYQVLLDSQEGRCGICKRTPEEVGDGRYLAVDHCHETGKIRGLLCRPCNTGIGQLGDSAERLKSALNYLEENNS